MTTTFTDQLVELVGYLDARVAVIGGYSLDVLHYDFRPGQHILRVQAFPDSLEQAQDISDALDLTFVQCDGSPDRYDATRDGVEYCFTVGRADAEGNPTEITPTGALR